MGKCCHTSRAVLLLRSCNLNDVAVTCWLQLPWRHLSLYLHRITASIVVSQTFESGSDHHAIWSSLVVRR